MAYSAKVENYCLQRTGTTKGINVDIGTRACINCIWYEQYFRQNRGMSGPGHRPTQAIVSYTTGGVEPLRQPCKDYETKE